MSSCVHDLEPWWCDVDCPECPLELFSPESECTELLDGIRPSNSGVIIIMLSLSAAFFELTLARSDMWLSISIVSEESIVCNVSNFILTLSQFWISADKPRKRNVIRFASVNWYRQIRNAVISSRDSQNRAKLRHGHLRIDKGALSKAKLDTDFKRGCVGCYEPSNANLIATS